nr:hypothetical protein [Maledivibacter halophilus]
MSKLSIRGEDSGEIVNYDRGWDIRPSEEFEEVFNAVLNFLENSPERFN